MILDHFVEGPCSWEPSAPRILRQRVFRNPSTWSSYSTSRYIGGVEPTVPYAVEVGGSRVGLALNIELLPEEIADGWRAHGLRFATGADIDDMGFLATLTRSLDLIRAAAPLLGTVSGICRSLHVVLAPDGDFDVSFSDPCLPFSVFVSCPPAGEQDRVERLAENLVHEALHLQLSLMETIEPLVVGLPEEKPVFSPWKGEGRTVLGLLHAVYVFGNLRCFWECIAAKAPGSSSFASRRIETIEHEMARALHLVESRSLTPTGRRLALSFLAS